MEKQFLVNFLDAVRLYDAAVACENAHLNSALAKYSTLSVNYAIGAAENSFLQSIKMIKILHEKIDEFSTVDKFDYVLQWHTDHDLNSTAAAPPSICLWCYQQCRPCGETRPMTPRSSLCRPRGDVFAISGSVAWSLYWRARLSR